MRAAGIVSKSQRKAELLAGEQLVTTSDINKDALIDLRGFMACDLLGTDLIKKPPVEESIQDEEGNLKILNEIVDDGKLRVEGTDTPIDVTWVHVLNYMTGLQRACTYSSLALGTDAALNVGVPQNSVAPSLKLVSVHRHLKKHLTAYERDCCPLMPVDVIRSIMLDANMTVPDAPSDEVCEQSTDLTEKKEAGECSFQI